MHQLPILFLSLLHLSLASFPVVDLGYAHHAATTTNTTANNITYASYSNIRFAQPPLDSLRFKRPVTPPPSSSGVQTGHVAQNSTNCIQTVPVWLVDPPGINGTTWGNEDCLFLDVHVPEGLTPDSKVPILHWFYGGGFFFGAKDTGGDPASLMNDMDPEHKFIVVASNYRVGPFGWMSSVTEPSIDQNAGLYDALEGLYWTRRNAHLFGGDASRVTVMGQSAGGGIIAHLLAADAAGHDVGGFNQAILSSPGYRPHVNRSLEMTGIYNLFLNYTKCSDAACLRKLSADEMHKANKYMMIDHADGPFGGPSIGFEPIIDGDLVKDVPDRILHKKPTQGNVKRVIAGGMRSDGIGNPANSSWPVFLKDFARTPSSSTVDVISSLYANDSDLAPATSELAGQTVFDKMYGDIIYECHSYMAARRYAKNGPGRCPSAGDGFEAYRYDMSIPPALHANDMYYYFYSSLVAKLKPTTVKKTALQFQDYIRRFILGQSMGSWPEYTANGLASPTWVNVTAEGFKAVVGKEETVRQRRCEALLKLLDKKQDGW